MLPQLRKPSVWENFFLLSLILGFFSLNAQQAQAQSSSSSYTAEAGVMGAILLEQGIKGMDGRMRALGVQGSYPVTNTALLSAGVWLLYEDPDQGYVLDFLFRNEFPASFIELFMEVGLHYTRLSLEPDRDANNECVEPGCLDDSGNHYGFLAGGGVQYRISDSIPFRVGMRFYLGPSLWLLIHAGLHFRL